MDEYIKDLIKISVKVTIIVIILTFTLTFLNYKINVNICKANHIKVIVNKIEVYKGKNAFIKVSSGGYTTTVDIYKQLYPIPIVIKSYTSKDVVIEPQ